MRLQGFPVYYREFSLLTSNAARLVSRLHICDLLESHSQSRWKKYSLSKVARGGRFTEAAELFTEAAELFTEAAELFTEAAEGSSRPPVRPWIWGAFALVGLYRPRIYRRFRRRGNGYEWCRGQRAS